MKNQPLGPHAAFAAAIFLLTAVPGLAADDPEDIIKYRQNVMKSNGANLSAAGAIIQKKVNFGPRLADHANAVAAGSKNIAALFPPGSDFGTDTEALDAVWTNRARFEKLAKDGETKAAAFAKAVAAKDPQMGARFKELADSCKACHKDFRKEQN
ncbi:MAG: c-type cytochrome [Gammaproteobacteria bacterium]